MKRYAEPTPRARQLFFLALALFGGAALLVDRLEQILPPISSDTTTAINQILQHSLLGAAISTVFHACLAATAILLARRVVKSGQWPPIGMSVPFRTPIKEIQRPWIVWIYLTLLLCIFAGQTALSWYKYAKARQALQALRQTIEKTPSTSVRPTHIGVLPPPSAESKR